MKPTLLTLAVVLAAFASPGAVKLDQALLMYGRYAECEKSFDEAFAAVKAAGGKLSFAVKDKHFKIGNRAITTLRAGRDVKWVLGKLDEVKALVDYALEKPRQPPATRRRKAVSFISTRGRTISSRRSSRRSNRRSA